MINHRLRNIPSAFIIFICAIFSIACYSPLGATTCDTEDYQEYANALDKTQVESVVLMSDKFIKNSSVNNTSCQSALFSIFRSFYYAAMNSFDDSNDTLLDQYPLADKVINNLNLKIAPAGWIVDESEGTYYIAETGDWFLSRFGNHLPDNWNQFLLQRKKEIDEKFSEDAGLLISWDQLSQRITFWENFLAKHPSFDEKETVKYYLSSYVSTYLTGMDNTRIYSFQNNRIEPDLIQSYEKYIKNNTKSKYHAIIQSQYELLKSHGFIYSEEVGDKLNAMLKKHDIETMLGYQPPTY